MHVEEFFLGDHCCTDSIGRPIIVHYICEYIMLQGTSSRKNSYIEHVLKHTPAVQ